MWYHHSKTDNNFIYNVFCIFNYVYLFYSYNSFVDIHKNFDAKKDYEKNLINFGKMSSELSSSMLFHHLEVAQFLWKMLLVATE